MTATKLSVPQVQEMLDLLKGRLDKVEDELTLLAKGEVSLQGYYLISKSSNTSEPGHLVVVSTDGLFRLDASAPDKGYCFESYTKADRARNKWNHALNAQQKAAGCEVYVASRALYLERILENGSKTLALLEAAIKRLQTKH